MVQLISSYTFRDTYNILFERAESDLESLLSRSERPPALRSDNSLFQALQGLCSAVAAFHHFAHPELELYLKGYHHDLKPENILVNGSRFLLSDFGLSKLKDMDMKSKTLSKDIMGYYLAPESETIEDGFQNKLIGQPSDIWALGCILAVVLTYIRRGPSGVQEFEQRRRHKSQRWTAYTFHCAGQPNQVVEAWLTELEGGGTTEVYSLIALIRDILKIDPSDRPTAETVSTRMEFLAIQSVYNSTMCKFERVEKTPQDLVVWIEQERVTLFGQALGLGLLREEWRKIQRSTTANTNFESIRDQLTALGQDLGNLAEHTDLTSYPVLLVKRIRNQVDQLWNSLLPSVRAQLEASLEAKIVSTKDLMKLENVHKSFEEDLSYKNIGLAAAIRSMIILANRNEVKNPELKWDANQVHETVPAITPFSSLARLTDENGQPQMEVLVEWLEYDNRWQGSTGEELISRIESIAEILHDKQNSRRFRALHCIKYFHDSSRRSYGLVFEIPTPYRADMSLRQPPPAISLASLITCTRKERIRPSIGDAFRLAKALAVSVLRWHEVGWIHRGVSAHSIIFFGIDPKSSLESISEPSFLGFQFSRPNDPKAFTLGPTDKPELLDYCHPEYLKVSARYRPEFDYYSLGLVLLEIGYWKTVKDIIKSFSNPDNSPQNLRNWILQTYVKDLHMVMGSVYQAAVRKCLTFRSGQDLETDGVVPLNVQEEFRTDVLEKIQLCFA
jgi:serine/threonine protein kinase